MRPVKGEAVSEAVDPLRKFFDELGHRLDLYRTLVPVGHAWPTLNVHDLYLAWIRDGQNRHEARLLRERLGFLGEENNRLRRALVGSCGPELKTEEILATSDHHANGQTVWRCGRCGHLNDPGEVSVLWDDNNDHWFQVGDKYGSNEPKCHSCLANIYVQPELMGQMYRLEPIEAR